MVNGEKRHGREDCHHHRRRRPSCLLFKMRGSFCLGLVAREICVSLLCATDSFHDICISFFKIEMRGTGMEDNILLLV